MPHDIQNRFFTFLGIGIPLWTGQIGNIPVAVIPDQMLCDGVHAMVIVCNDCGRPGALSPFFQNDSWDIAEFPEKVFLLRFVQKHSERAVFDNQRIDVSEGLIVVDGIELIIEILVDILQLI